MHAPRAIAVAFLAGTPVALGQGPPTHWVPARLMMPRQQNALAWDAARERVMLFGGGMSSPGGKKNDLWQWDGAEWTPRTGPAPLERFLHAMAYDSGRRRLVLFGGETNNYVFLDDTWEWDGVRWHQALPTVHPTARRGHAMAYDPVRGRVVLYGGNQNSSECWEWDGTQWSLRPGGGAPGGRSGAAMAFHSASQRVVLFGGTPVVSGGYLDDTWEWDGVQWLQRQPPNRPSPRADAGLADQPARQRLVLFGGVASITTFTDTWEWDGQNWLATSPPVSPPSGSWDAAHDASRGRTVLYGGSTQQAGSPMETWEWDGSQWTRAGTATVPPTETGGSSPSGLVAGNRPPVSYDPVQQRVLFFGGQLVLNPTSETWAWNQHRWTRLPTINAPPARASTRIAWDPVNARTLLFGGAFPFSYPNDCWSFDGVTWTQLAPANLPPPRTGHSMVTDTAQQRVLLFGGYANISGNQVYRDDLWVWNGTNWILQNPPTRPFGRLGHAMAWDSQRQRLVLWGGANPQGVFVDTWEWDGTNWTQYAPVPAPPPLFEPAMAFDPLRGVTVLAGSSPNTPLQCWEWNGTSWTAVSTADAPHNTRAAAFVFDELHGEMMFLEGRDATWSWLYGETWIYSTKPPALVEEIGTGCPGAYGVPDLAVSVPYLDNRDFTVDVVGAPGGALAVLGWSFNVQLSPLGGGCTLYLGSLVLLQFLPANAGGMARAALTIPENPSLIGFNVFVQGGAFDPASAIGLSTTSARRIWIGR